MRRLGYRYITATPRKFCAFAPPPPGYAPALTTRLSELLSQDFLGRKCTEATTLRANIKQTSQTHFMNHIIYKP